METSITKFCKRCSSEKSVSDFYVDKTRKDGLTVYCKNCTVRITIETRDKEKHNNASKRYSANHPEKVKEIRKNTYQRLRQDLLFCQAAVERARKWAKDNPEKIREHGRKKYRKNPEKNNERVRKWEKENPDQHRETKKAWRLKNPDKGRRDARNRRAREKNATGTIKKCDWEKLLDLYGEKCLCCGTTKDITLDHVVPLASGGTNTIENAQPLCRSCNSKKATKMIDYRPFPYYEKST